MGIRVGLKKNAIVPIACIDCIIDSSRVSLLDAEGYVLPIYSHAICSVHFPKEVHFAKDCIVVIVNCEAQLLRPAEFSIESGFTFKENKIHVLLKVLLLK